MTKKEIQIGMKGFHRILKEKCEYTEVCAELEKTNGDPSSIFVQFSNLHYDFSEVSFDLITWEMDTVEEKRQPSTLRELLEQHPEYADFPVVVCGNKGYDWISGSASVYVDYIMDENLKEHDVLVFAPN